MFKIPKMKTKKEEVLMRKTSLLIAPSSLKLTNNPTKYYGWDDIVYQNFMMKVLQKLENREL